MIFVYAVVGWFIFSALDLGERAPNVDFGRFGEQATTTSTTAAPVTAHALQIDVTSLRARPSDDQVVVNVTLEIDNTGSERINFDAKQLTLLGADGVPIVAYEGPKAPMSIPPDTPQLAPLKFALPPSTTGPFALKYAGHTVFNGYST